MCALLQMFSPVLWASPNKFMCVSSWRKFRHSISQGTMLKRSKVKTKIFSVSSWLCKRVWHVVILNLSGGRVNRKKHTAHRLDASSAVQDHLLQRTSPVLVDYEHVELRWVNYSMRCNLTTKWRAVVSARHALAAGCDKKTSPTQWWRRGSLWRSFHLGKFFFFFFFFGKWKNWAVSECGGPLCVRQPWR